MSFIMPKVNLNKCPGNLIYLMIPLIDHKNYLVTMPPFNVTNQMKLLHNELLKKLYTHKDFKTPIKSAWNMPHIISFIKEDDLKEAGLIANQLLESGIFYKGEYYD